MKYLIGVDIGGTNTAVGITDENYSIVKKCSFSTEAPTDPDLLCRKIYDTALSLCKETGLDFDRDISSVGLACPGLVKDEKVIFASNLGFNNVDLSDIFKNISGKETHTLNDANSAALGEAILGSGKNCSLVVAVTIGTGIGGGMVFNKEIFDGFNGAGAELGHITVKPGGRKCSCGGNGCFEAYCSMTALIKDAVKTAKKHPESLLYKLSPDLTTVDGKMVFDAADMGDKAMKEVIEKFISYLKIGICNIITLIQPEIVCIGGGVSKQGEKLLKPLRDMIYSEGLIKQLKEKPIITAATLENDAGICGAAIYSDTRK